MLVIRLLVGGSMSQLEARSRSLLAQVEGVSTEEAVLLLWAFAGALHGRARLADLQEVRGELAALIAPFCASGVEPDPEQAWRNLRRTGWWDSDGTNRAGLTGELDRRLGENIWFRDAVEEQLIDLLGDAEIAEALLIELGLRPRPVDGPVQRESLGNANWDMAVGEVILRRELHKLYGGAWYGGMEPSGKTPNVLLFTDPAIGEQFGYAHDGWHPDGSYRYTGEGKVGDQEFTFGNRATRDHVAEGRALRLFEIRGTSVAYMGEFVLDGSEPYHWDTSKDILGNVRKVIVFHLRAV